MAQLTSDLDELLQLLVVLNNYDVAFGVVGNIHAGFRRVCGVDSCCETSGDDLRKKVLGSNQCY